MTERDDELFGFEKLEAWQLAAEFAHAVYALTKGFPREEMFGLTSQLRRASVSVGANIAEGTSRTSGKDQARFYEIAYGSLNEIVTMLRIAQRESFVSQRQVETLRADAAKLCRMLSGLRRSATDR